MGFLNKIAAQLDKNFLNNLKDTENTCVEVLKKTQRLALHPYHLNNLNASIAEILNTGVTKYKQQLDGILLGYQNAKLLESEATIHDENCFMHIDVEAEFFVFKPKIGATLTAYVNKQSKDHVGALVHKVFNVSIPKTGENWIGDELSIGQKILVSLTQLQLKASLPYMRGAIRVENEEETAQQDVDVVKKKKKKKQKNDNEDVELDDSKVNKRKRKRKSDELGQEEQDSEVKPRKNKKTKLSFSFESD